MWIKDDTGQVFKSYQAIRDSGLNISFPEDIWNADLLSIGISPVLEVPPPDYDPDTQDLIEMAPVKTEGAWVQKWAVTEVEPEEITQRLEQKRQSMNVTPFQAKAALLDAGLLDDIGTLMADPLTDRVLLLAWNNVTEFRRLSPMVAGIASALGWSDEQLDTLFEAAALKTA